MDSWLLVLFQLLEILVSWPAAVVIVAILFRRSLVDLIGEVKRLKIGDHEIERFDRAVERSEALVTEIEELQLLVAAAALSEMRAVDDSPYAPEAHKAHIKDSADKLEEHLSKVQKKIAARRRADD
ncbi:hypothetical protein [Tropicimonas sp. S265A]|uniref:hypothetical protein n=1 Tax=Tropicimonas sp. S265A TaxID=3415134 RepID=UPI003C7C8EFC